MSPSDLARAARLPTAPAMPDVAKDAPSTLTGTLDRVGADEHRLTLQRAEGILHGL